MLRLLCDETMLISEKFPSNKSSVIHETDEEQGLVVVWKILFVYLDNFTFMHNVIHLNNLKKLVSRKKMRPKAKIQVSTKCSVQNYIFTRLPSPPSWEESKRNFLWEVKGLATLVRFI
jgi:hypothetical protein